mgnify:CR=1 FL=1
MNSRGFDASFALRGVTGEAGRFREINYTLLQAVQFGPVPVVMSETPVGVTQRMVMNHFFTANRLLLALGMRVRRHEQVFDELETHVLKRTVSEPRA